MINYTDFHQVFPAELQSPYDRQLQNDIDTHRKELDGVLFVDRVLKALGIAKGTVYLMNWRLDPFRTDLLLSQNVPPKDRRYSQAIPPASLRRQHCHSPQALAFLLHLVGL